MFISRGLPVPKLNRELTLFVPQLKRVNVVLGDRENERTPLVVPNTDVAAQGREPVSYLGDLCANVGHAI
jgi:hypothetical protein